MKSPLNVIKDMVNKYPNDMELGARIRWYIRWLKGDQKGKDESRTTKWGA